MDALLLQDLMLGVRIWRCVRKAARLQREEEEADHRVRVSRHAPCDAYVSKKNRGLEG